MWASKKRIEAKEGLGSCERVGLQARPPVARVLRLK